MPFYQSKGTIPHKRHTVFKNKNKLCYEELVSREGFSSIYTNMYHLNMPTKIKKVGKNQPTRIRRSRIVPMANNPTKPIGKMR